MLRSVMRRIIPSAGPPEQRAAPEHDPDARGLVSQFESLGDNCEFGVVQRYAGIEPLGLFRWNWTPLPALLAVLDADLANIEPARIEIQVDSFDEYIVGIEPWEFRYHTHYRQGSVDVGRLREQQTKVIGLLKRKLLEDLRSASKIFVRKGSDTGALDQAVELHRQLRRFGPNTLLWVVPEDDNQGAGTVEVLRPGLLKAYIDRLAPIRDAYDTSPIWFDICRNAAALHQAGCLPGTAVGRPWAWATNLLRRVHTEQDAGWWSSPTIETRVLIGETPVEDGVPVKEHRLLAPADPADDPVCGYPDPGGLAADAAYSGSVYVWIPADAAVERAGMVMRGASPPAVADADPGIRDAWQRVCASNRARAGQEAVSLGLFVSGSPGAAVRTTCWQLETGPTATRYVSSRFGSLANAAS